MDGWWRVTVFYHPWPEDVREVTDAYEELGCPLEDVMKIRWIVGRGIMNKGATYSSGSQRRSVVVIGRATSWEQFFDTVTHELRHVVDDIMLWYYVENLGEPPAYTQGEIGRQMARVIRDIACPCCGGPTTQT